MSRWFEALAVAFVTLVPASSLHQGVRQRAPRPPRTPVAGGSFEIVSCSLGCVRGKFGFACETAEIHVNEEIRVTFNQPVDPVSISNNSFQMIELATGRTPPAVFTLDPRDPSTIVYRPAMTLDSAGNPVFGLMENHVYVLRLPGTDQDPLGPYVSSIEGEPNRTRLQCTLVASRGVSDPSPGRPRAKLTVLAVLERDPVTGQPTRIGTVPAEGAVDVLRTSPIRIAFDDLMNPATLANPVTGHSDFIHVFFDPDGNVQDRSDQVLVPGSFTLTLDQNGNTTTALFQAPGGLPAAGTRRPPARIVVELSPFIQDLAANALLNPGSTVFSTEAR